jgi:hypothetical protein
VRLSSVLLAAVLCTARFASAQKLDLKFDSLAAKASGKAEIDLDANMLRLVLGMADHHAPTMPGIRALRVRNYTFDKTGEYTQRDLDTVRAQVNGQARWVKIVNQKHGEETAEIWMAADGDKFGACLIISAEPTELSIVYLEGTLSPADVKGLLEHDGLHGLMRLADN